MAKKIFKVSPFMEMLIPIVFLLLLVFVISQSPLTQRVANFNLLVIGALGSLFLSELSTDRGLLGKMREELTIPVLLEISAIGILLGVFSLLLANGVGAAWENFAFFGTFFVEPIEVRGLEQALITNLIQPITETIIMVFFLTWLYPRLSRLVPPIVAAGGSIFAWGLLFSLFHSASNPIFLFPGDLIAFWLSTFAVPFTIVGMFWGGVWFYKQSFWLVGVMHLTMNTISTFISTLGTSQIVIPLAVGIGLVLLFIASASKLSVKSITTVAPLRASVSQRQVVTA